MDKPASTSTKWIVANCIAMCVFLGIASQSWIEPELADIPGANAGAALIWAISALPIFAAFVLANLAWLAASLARRQEGRRWRPAATATLLMAVWAGVFLFDNLHHGA